MQAQNSPDLASAFRIAQRIEVVFETVNDKASKPVRVIMEDPTGAAVKAEARYPWVEQLAKAIQQLSQRLPQANAKDSEPGPQQ